MSSSRDPLHADERLEGSAYEAPSVTVIGPVSEFTFASNSHDQSDHSAGFTGGHKV
jgi:hypothetical protein